LQDPAESAFGRNTPALAPLGKPGSFDGLSCIPKPPHLPGVMALLTARKYEAEMAFPERVMQYYGERVSLAVREVRD